MFCERCGSELVQGYLFCTKCGKRIDNTGSKSNNINNGMNGGWNNSFNSGGNNLYNNGFNNQMPYMMNNIGQKYKGVFSTARLVLGIISMVLFLIAFGEACEVDEFYTMIGSDDAEGAMGIVFSFLLLAAGIVGVCSRNSERCTGAFTAGGLYLGGALFTIGTGETFPDLPIFGIISFAFGIVFIIAGIKSMD